MSFISEDILTSLLIKADVFFAYCQILTRFVKDLSININITMIAVSLTNLISHIIFNPVKQSESFNILKIIDTNLAVRDVAPLSARPSVTIT